MSWRKKDVFFFLMGVDVYVQCLCLTADSLCGLDMKHSAGFNFLSLIVKAPLTREQRREDRGPRGQMWE